MSQCLICQTKYVEGAVTHCSTCGWDLKQYSLTPEGLGAAQQAKVNWAKEIWQQNQQLKQELSKYVSPGEKLVSSLGIDYKKLRNFLAKKQWRDADQETATLMFTAVGRERKSVSDILSIKQLRAFPCEDLSIIDHLWVKYSQGRFGFSVQNKIYKEANNIGGIEVSSSFEGIVGWQIGEYIFNSKDLKYQKLTFNESAPKGHLPAFFIEWKDVTYTQECYEYGDSPQVAPWVFMGIKDLLDRCDECKLQS